MQRTSYCTAILVISGIILGSIVIASADSAPIKNGVPFVTPQPEDLIIYQIFIDRFNNGDPANDNGNPRGTFNPFGARDFHGGDLEGIRQKLAYIKGMGFNAIWITPFVENVRDYHGYAAYDWFKVDPNFGDIAKLQQLVNEANAMGIAFYFDLVAGHQGDLIDSTDPGWPTYLPPPDTYNLRWNSGLRYPPPFDSLSYFHAQGQISSFVPPIQELGELASLDDLKTDTQFVRDEMFNIWSFWMQQTNVSGFRVDTVKHVDVGFWEDFLPRMRDEATTLGKQNFYTFGEIFGADPNFMSTYIGTVAGEPYKFDGALDFLFYGRGQNVFARRDAPTWWMISGLDDREATLPGHHLKMPNFLDNHDVSRFMNVAAGRAGFGLADQLRRLEIGLTFLYTAPGPPVVYYGTEQAFDGGGDPQNREDMWDGEFEFGPSLGDNFDQSSLQYQFISRLGLIRNTLAPLRRGDTSWLYFDVDGPGLLAFTRDYLGERVLVILNNDWNQKTLPQIFLPGLENEILVDALNPNALMQIDARGYLTTRTVAGQSAQIWITQALLPPMPPAVISFQPAHKENKVSKTLSEASILFSTPMNTSVTQGAVSISPVISYTTSWNTSGTLLTLNLNQTLEFETEYTITVSTTAQTSTGQNLLIGTSASWTVERDPILLPPLPPRYRQMAKTDRIIIIDGDDSEWPSTAGQQANSGRITLDQVFLWQDALNDDDGPGSYTYPTNSVFTTDDADLDYLKVTFTESNVNFAIKPVSVEPLASFYTPYIGIGIDTGVFSSDRTLGYAQAGGTTGIATVDVRNDVNIDFELTFTGPRGAFLIDSQGTIVNNPPWAFSQATGIVEISVPRFAMNLSTTMDNQVFNLVPYMGLETFGAMREVQVSNGQWDIGGGISSTTDPNVLDLASNTQAEQRADLANFDVNNNSIIINSILQLRLTDGAPAPTPTPTPTPIPTPTPVPDAITITAPNNSETFVRRESIPVRWLTTGNTGSEVNIFLFKAADLSDAFAFGVPNTGQFDLLLPDTLQPGEDYHLLIVSVDNPSISDWTDQFFTILAGHTATTLPWQLLE